jgi:hypothetical protein
MKRLIIAIIALLLIGCATAPQVSYIRWGHIFNDTATAQEVVAYYADVPETLVVDEIILSNGVSDELLFRKAELVIWIKCTLCGEIEIKHMQVTDEWLLSAPGRVAGISLSEHMCL